VWEGQVEAASGGREREERRGEKRREVGAPAYL